MGKHHVEKKKNKALRIVGIIFLIILTILVIAAGIGLGFVYSKLGKMNVEEIDQTAIGLNEETQESLERLKRIDKKKPL